jgi:AraC-like DNA-binding protein
MHDNSSGPVSFSGERDTFSDVLMDLRPVGVSYGRCELRGRWGIDFEPVTAARFHFLAHGTAWIRIEGCEWIELRAGDAVLLPWGAAHKLAATVDSPTRPLQHLTFEPWGERTYRVRTGRSGARTLLFCGTLEFEAHALHPLLDLMPIALTVRAAHGRDTGLRAILDAMADEVKSQRVGAATVLTRLADAVVVKLLRAWHEEHRDERTGLLAAMRDRRIGRVLAAIHRRPGDPWTVESMATEAHLSRSAFAERFSALVGRPVASYVAKLRMHLASHWLRDPHTTVAQVASRLGYESEASFSRAFKRLQGIAPGAFRSAQQPIARAEVTRAPT